MSLFSAQISAQTAVKLSGVITAADAGHPLAGANISVQGSLLGAAAQNDGSYEINLMPGSYTLLVQYIGYRTIKAQVNVVVDQPLTKNFALEEDVLQMSEVVATGTRFSGRTVIESPVPVDVISAKEIHATGLTQTTQILQQLVPSYNAPQPSITDGSDHMRPATLRGLGPDQVLILVNGKRRHTSALVHVNGSVGRGSTGADLNAIPANAIQKIEVLRDGAAAQYGSDAIAGVINIVLKKQMGLDAGVSYSQNLSSVTRGYADDGTGGPQDVNYNDGETLNLHLGYGLRIGQDGSLYVSGQARKRDRAVRAGLDPRQQYFDDDSREDDFDRLNHVYGQGESDDYSIFFNGSIPVGEAGGQFYAFGGYNDREGSTGCFYRRANDNRTVRSIHPDGFLPTLDNRLKDISASAGIKGNLGSWTYDLSETFGNNSFNFIVDNTNNVSQGDASATHFDSGTLKFRQATTNLDLLNAIDIGLAAPLNIGVGAEFRAENYKIDPGEEASYLDGRETVIDGPNAGDPGPVGASCFRGFSPRNETDESRTNFGAYVDLETKLSEQFLVGVAARFESYDDFGETVTGKIASRFELTEQFALRGAVSTGFRAPSLAQSYYSAIATNFISTPEGLVGFEVGTFPVTDPVAQALGAKPLDAEKSVNLSLGFTASSSNYSLTVDAYQIEIDERIVFTENFVGTEIQAFLESQGIAGANGGRYFTNAMDTRTRGIDIIGRYAMGLGYGTLRLVAAMNFNKTEITNKDQIETPAELAALTSTPLLGVVEQGRFEKGQPRQRINLTGNYGMKRWNFMLRTQFYGEVTEFRNNGNNQTYSGKWLTDLEAGYDIQSGITIAIGANNLFDVYPDRQDRGEDFNGIFPYDGLSPFGFFGRSVYTRLNVSL